MYMEIYVKKSSITYLYVYICIYTYTYTYTYICTYIYIEIYLHDARVFAACSLWDCLTTCVVGGGSRCERGGVIPGLWIDVRIWHTLKSQCQILAVAFR